MCNKERVIDNGTNKYDGCRESEKHVRIKRNRCNNIFSTHKETGNEGLAYP